MTHSSCRAGRSCCSPDSVKASTQRCCNCQRRPRHRRRGQPKRKAGIGLPVLSKVRPGAVIARRIAQRDGG
jgi:hypothetical protein